MSITGQRIKEQRKRLDMSADDVAEQLGVSRSTVFRYENGHIEKIPATILEKLAAILKTTPAYLMGWQEDASDFHLSHEESLAWKQHSSLVEQETLLKEGDGEYGPTDQSTAIFTREFLPDDKDKITVMAETYLNLTDLGKKKAYDYIMDLSEQPKYQKR